MDSSFNLTSASSLPSDVQRTTEAPFDSPGSAVRFSLHRCRALKDSLNATRQLTIVPDLPAKPVQSRAVAKHFNAANDDTVKAELETMNKRIKSDYECILKLHNQVCDFLRFTVKAENSLTNDISIYENVLQNLHEGQEELQVMDKKFSSALNATLRSLESQLNHMTKRVEAQNAHIDELKKKNWQPGLQTGQATDERIRELESYLRTFKDRSISLQNQVYQLRAEKKRSDDALFEIQRGKFAPPERIQELEEDLKLAKRRLTSSNEALRTEEAKTSRLRNLTEKLQKDVSEADGRAYKSQNALEEMREEKAALSRRVNALREDLAQAERETEFKDEFISEIEQAKDELSRRTDRLENELREKTTMLEAKERQLSEAQSQKAHMFRRLEDMHQKLTARGVDVVPKGRLSRLENDLQQTRSLLQQKENEVRTWVTQSSQWNNDRVAMEKEIENLTARLESLLQDNPTT